MQNWNYQILWIVVQNPEKIVVDTYFGYKPEQIIPYKWRPCDVTIGMAKKLNCWGPWPDSTLADLYDLDTPLVWEHIEIAKKNTAYIW